MLVSIDLTGDVISYACADGNEIVSEALRNTIGFRTSDLFRIEGAINALMRVVKDMVELTAGDVITEAICVLPQYVTYSQRERVKRAATECGIKLKKLITGALASAYGLFQNEELGRKTILLSSVRPDYAEFLLFDVDGDVLSVMSSASIQYEKDPGRLDPEKLKRKIEAELRAMYKETGLEFGERNEALYITFDERSEYLKRLFTEELQALCSKESVPFDNDQARGAFAHLLKLNSEKEELIKKCFSVDCCIEGISISSGVGGELLELFRRNTPLPAQKTVELPVSSDNVLCFYSGNYRNRENDDPIGTCRIPSAYFGQKVIVKVTLTEEAIVEYVVLDAKKQIIFPRQVLK